MRILGIDVGQALGWAVLEGDTVLGYGTLKLQTKLPHAVKLERIGALVEAWTPDVVCMEDVAFSKFAKASASYWRIRTLTEVILQARGISLEVVNVTTLKRWATGAGNAKKPAMVRAANGRLGTALIPEKKAHWDQADALLCAAWLRAA